MWHRGQTGLPGTPVQHPGWAKLAVCTAVLHQVVTPFTWAHLGTVAASRGSHEELVALTSQPPPLGAHTPRAGEIWHSCWSQGSG